MTHTVCKTYFATKRTVLGLLRDGLDVYPLYLSTLAMWVSAYSRLSGRTGL
jgi:hypothetical protein